MSTVAIEKNTVWLQTFDELQHHGSGPGWLRGLRARAFASFWELGFPNTHHEDWRFTNVSAIANGIFMLAAPELLRVEDFEPFCLPGAACQLVFVNGAFVPELSRIGRLPQGVVVGALADAPAGELQAALEGDQEYLQECFTALNLAFVLDGAYINVPRNAILDAPIHILYVSSTAAPAMAHIRNRMVFGEQCQATVVEDYVSLGKAPFFTNAVTDLMAGANATVEHYLLEREDRQAYNVSTLNLRQGRTANVASHSVLLGGGLVRNNVHPMLQGEGGECLINGLFIGSGKQHMDNYMKVEHAAPHCGSRQFYNGILDDQARGVFHGRIIVHKNAQKTDAKQTNRNLLLSDDAQIDTKPQLEIYADDVKCTHGATIGQIDETALFYLRSRGVPEGEARRMLLFAFAEESLQRMRSGAVRDWLSGSIAGWLPQRSTQSAAGTQAVPERRWEEVG